MSTFFRLQRSTRFLKRPSQLHIKTLWLNNFKTRAAINAKISVFVICVETIIYLFLHNLHDCTFNKYIGPFVTFNYETVK